MEIPSGARDRTIEGAGVKLHYLEWGDASKPAMVLLHGFMSHAHTWDTFSGAATAGYHVIALDQRGHGDSGHPRQHEYGVEHYVADLGAVIEQLKLAPTILVGHSMGGRNAVVYAAEHPEKVTKLVIVDSPPETPPAFAKMLEEADKKPPPENPQHPRFATIEEVVTSAMKEYPLTPELLMRHATRHNLKQVENGAYTWKHDPWLSHNPYRTKRTPLYDDLARLRCPTMLVRGSESPVLPQVFVEKMTSVIPDCTFALIEGAAHDVCMCQPETFNREVLKFLAA